MTTDYLILALLAACLVLLVVCLIMLAGRKTANFDEAERRLRDDISQLRQELNTTAVDNNDRLLRQIIQLSDSNEKRMADIRLSLDSNMEKLQLSNEKKLEAMRLTVDEKLQQTLETRLGESFKLVSQRLELVHQGLGEMHSLAADVGDLKKVLNNVKTRGTWGEIQLGSLLEQIMSPSQYEVNCAVNPEQSDKRVEYAVKLPGRDENKPLYLPIDAKFPLEDYQLLLQAQEAGDVAAVSEAGKALERRVKVFAKAVGEKYINPPHTTDFAIIFLPLEGLYSELLRRPGLQDNLQRDHRVVIAGPTTIAALLNSLQMGFRTLAVEKRANEVWQLLAQVKEGFDGFGLLLEKTQKKIQEAGNSIEDAARKSRSIGRKLKNVGDYSLPAGDALSLVKNGQEEDFVDSE